MNLDEWSLSSMTKQEVFDHVVHHLRVQKERSVYGEYSCKYRIESKDEK